MYLFQNYVFVKTTFIYLIGLLFPNATFIYFWGLLHSTFISTYITTPYLLPLHIYYPSTLPLHIYFRSHMQTRGAWLSLDQRMLHKIEGR